MTSRIVTPWFMTVCFVRPSNKKSPSRIAMVLWKWVPILGSQTSEGAQVPDPFAPSCQCPSILLADDEQVIDCLIHRLQVLHIVKLYQAVRKGISYLLISHSYGFRCKDSEYFANGKINRKKILAPVKAARIIHGVTNRYPMAYDRMFRTAIYQKAPSQIATVLWKWVPVLGSQTSHRACPRVTTEILNPSIGVENETFHKPLIIQIDFTMKRTTIIAMLHHLIVLLAFFCFRPDASQTEETSLALFCRKFSLFVFRHNQLVGQPLTVALRERKALQICP